MTRKNLFKAIFISGLGNIFEWYDFMVFASLTPIISQVFFPGHSVLLSLIYVYGTFAAGFLTRPFGAFLFGYLGDHIGRKYALLTSILAMAIPTFLIGCLPGYQSIGILAPILLTLLRLCQGLAMSGEMAGNIVFLVESAPSNLRTTISSLAISGALIGVLIGSNSVLWLTNEFGSQLLLEKLWRIPFWFAALLALFVYLLRNKLPETELFLAQKKPVSNPIKLCFTQYWRQLLIGIICLCSFTAVFYFLMVFSFSYFNNFVELPLSLSLFYVVIMQTAYLIFAILGGYLGDRFGRKRIAIIFNIIILIGSYPTLYFFSHAPHAPNILFISGLIFIAAISAIAAGVIPALESALLPTEVRFTGASLIHNLAMAIFGGGLPMLLVYLIKTSQNTTSPSWAIMTCCLLTLVGLTLLPKNQLSES